MRVRLTHTTSSASAEAGPFASGTCQNRLPVKQTPSAVKTALRGRALGVDLSDDQDSIVDRLCHLGIVEPQAVELAKVAVKFADEESATLVEELAPESSWPGRVVCRKHWVSGRRAMYLLLHRGCNSWHLQSALIE